MKKIFTLLFAIVASAGLAFAANDNFVLISNQNGSSIGLEKLSSHQTLEYSTDGNVWYSMTNETTISLNDGVSLYLRGKLTDNNTSEDYTQFAITGKVKASGNINYLWDYENPDAPLKDFCGIGLFKNCEGLSDVAEIKFPASVLTSGCYQALFIGCTNIIICPELPAEIMADSCYAAMFKGCTSLTTAPTLPATSLADFCYCNMFVDCSALINIPDILPATVMEDYCYYRMFYNCTSLTTSPRLPAMTLADCCYWSMFEGCTSLTKAPALPATTVVQSCYQRMFFGCKSITTAPVLPAATLAYNCYYKMFKQCSNLNYIKCLATDISADGCLTEWVKTIPSSGTFIKHANITSWPSGMNGIPSGWTTKSATPYMIYFDANGGLIPADGHMGITPETHLTGLSVDQKKGYVMVYTGTSAFWEVTNNNPTRAGHTFLGWFTAKTGGLQVYDKTGQCVTGNYWDENNKWIGTADLQLYAHWEASICTITWLQDDSTLIDKTTVPYGQIPTHISPTKEANAEFTYTFAGWDPEVVAVVGDATYIATYTATRKSYTITWLQDDGSLIDKTTVEYGQMPTHADPTKEPTDEFTYTFVKWAPNLVVVTDNATYMAVYDAQPRSQGIDDVNANTQATKVIRDGQIFILRGDKVYTVTGQEVR